MEAGGQDLRNLVMASSSSLENENLDLAVYTHPSIPRTSQNQDGFFSPLNFDSQWVNRISVESSDGGLEDLASSMGRLGLSSPFTNDFFGNGSRSSFLGLANCENLKGIKIGQSRLQDLPSVPRFSPLAYQDHLGTVKSCVSNNGIGHVHHGFNGKQLIFQQHHNFSSLEHVREQLVSLACGGCLLGKLEIIDIILGQVKDHLCDLMMDQHCNYLIQNVFEASSVEQKTKILGLVIRNDHKLKEVCMHNHGTRALQKLLELLKTPEQISAIILAVKRITVRLSKSINGGHVIQHCLKLFPPAFTKFLLDEVAKNCVEIATDKSGCSNFQKCLHYAKGDAMRRLIEQIVSYAFVLAEHPYGNYVVQYVIKLKLPHVNAAIISKLLGKYVQLSTNKHASNVVEDLLEFSEERDVAIIVGEIMYNRNFLGILQDPYGNFVVQRALRNCKGTLNKILSSSILSNYPHLHSHLYGKRVLAFAKARKICV